MKQMGAKGSSWRTQTTSDMAVHHDIFCMDWTLAKL